MGLPAARVGDQTTHGGVVTGPGATTVLIGGLPAVTVGDMHSCALPPNIHQPTISPLVTGSATVLIDGKPAIRVGDPCVCGASVVIGEPTVLIG